MKYFIDSLKKIYNSIIHDQVKIFSFVFIFIFVIVFLISHAEGQYSSKEFLLNLLVEAHGVIFEILIIGIIVTWLIKQGEAKQYLKFRISNYIDEIDDLRGLSTGEAAHKIRGNIVRLTKLGVSKVNLSYCYLKGANIQCVNLDNSIFTETNLGSANLYKCSLLNAKFTETKSQYTNYLYANLNGIDIQSANFKEAEFSKCRIQEANIFHANFQNASLFDTSFDGSGIAFSNFSESNLICASFVNCVLSNINFQNTNLAGVDFSNSKLSEVDFKGANFGKPSSDRYCIETKTKPVEHLIMFHWSNEETNLTDACIENCNLSNVKNITLEQLLKAKSLYNSEIRKSLLEQIQLKRPNLLNKPKTVHPSPVQAYISMKQPFAED